MNSRRAGALLLLTAQLVCGQQRSVAVTVDDLPYSPDPPGKHPWSAEKVNRKLLAAFAAHHVPVTGFVVQQRVESLGVGVGNQILKQWIARGFDLANHTNSHPDFNQLSPHEFEQEIVRGEVTIRPLMEQAGKQLRFFRFPMNHTGDTREKHDAMVAFLTQRGYRVAPCTIDNEDYVFSAAYLKMLAAGDNALASRLRAAYLDYTSVEIDYYANLNRQVLGYEPPQIMLLHDNQLNAETIEQILAMFEKKGYRFVTLDAALANAAYKTPDTEITAFGPMWGYRWAKERNVPVDGRAEQEPPQWIVEYGRKVNPRPR